MINQEFLDPREKISSVALFWDLLQGAKGAKSYEFLRMRPQFLLCRAVLRKVGRCYISNILIAPFSHIIAK